MKLSHTVAPAGKDFTVTSPEPQRFPFHVTQVYKATRTITMMVEAEDLESSVQAVESGAEEVPTFNHPEWRVAWDMQNEKVDPGAAFRKPSGLP